MRDNLYFFELGDIIKLSKEMIKKKLNKKLKNMKIDYLESKTQIKDNSLDEKLYDFIIIGSGPAAITLYKKILSKKINQKY